MKQATKVFLCCIFTILVSSTLSSAPKPKTVKNVRTLRGDDKDSNAEVLLKAVNDNKDDLSCAKLEKTLHDLYKKINKSTFKCPVEEEFLTIFKDQIKKVKDAKGAKKALSEIQDAKIYFP
mmetsp:Transcript_7090/g.7336  ORF Transcript_7090/g.7336 Transcript_7090/m.7336 type:complete len:121 (-) Transcript_7090:38-400(-)